jgi:hypothetical protein
MIAWHDGGWTERVTRMGREVEPHPDLFHCVEQSGWHLLLRPWGGILSDAPPCFALRSRALGGASRRVAQRREEQP